MTQKELIEFCKENDPNYNKDASFKVMEPMWSIPKGIGGIGITEPEFKNGFYVQIDTKGRKGFEHLDGRVFYFQETLDLANYNSHWKKYFAPLNNLEGWGKEIVKEVFIGKGIVEQIQDPFLKYTPMNVEKLKMMKEVFENPVEEFPIVKIQGKTTYKKRKSFIVLEIPKNMKIVNLNVMDDQEETCLSISSEEFSDLVDLMIEARKDLLI